MKKLLSVLTALTMVSGMAISVSAESYAQGDVDMDGVLTGHDAAIVSQYADGVLKMELSDEQLSLADMNGDGKVTSEDATLIAEKQEYVLGDIDCNGKFEVDDGTQIMRIYSWELLGIDVPFDQLIRADFDCNGTVDCYDIYLNMDIYANINALNDIFENGKYYVTVPPHQKDMYEGCVWMGVHGDTCSSWTDFCEKVNKACVLYYTDVDGDSELTISDVSAVLSAYANAAADIQDSYETDSMDVNTDGAVDLQDAAIILQAYAKNAAGLN